MWKCFEISFKSETAAASVVRRQYMSWKTSQIFSAYFSLSSVTRRDYCCKWLLIILSLRWKRHFEKPKYLILIWFWLKYMEFENGKNLKLKRYHINCFHDHGITAFHYIQSVFNAKKYSHVLHKTIKDTHG